VLKNPEAWSGYMAALFETEEEEEAFCNDWAAVVFVVRCCFMSE